MSEVILGDCIKLMKNIPDKSIDMILCDLPYGVTNEKWDEIIPLNSLWEQYNRIIKENGAIVLTGRQPFTSKLVLSNINNFRYELIWQKDKGTDFGNSNKKPLNAHENILVFYRKSPTYNKQMTVGKPYQKKNYRNNGKDDLNFTTDNSGIWINKGERTPISVIKIARDNIHKNTNIHPTQKPVELFEWLIKTFTNEGDIILDNAAGSGTTAIACMNTNRNYILMEKNEKYFNIINERVKNHELR